MKKVCHHLIIFMVFVCIALFCCTYAAAHQTESPAESAELTERELRSYANEHNTWVLCYKQGIRTGDYTRCDATNQNLYFSYMVHNCVDVYDWEGTFLYSILFPDRQNGAIYVRCDDTQAYIRDKFGTVYVFEGNETVKTMSEETADLHGFNFYWFYDHVPRITVDGQWITIREGSQATHKIRTPAMVSRTIPVSMENWKGLLIPGVAILLFLVISYYLAFRKRNI